MLKMERDHYESKMFAIEKLKAFFAATRTSDNVHTSKSTLSHKIIYVHKT